MANAASPVCPLCQGSGWKPAASAAPGHPRRVVRCDCMAGARAQRLLEAARIPPRYADCSLANFYKLDAPSGSLTNAHLKADGFVSNYPNVEKGLLLVGDVGVGKTHLAVGIIRELIEQKGVDCLFVDYRELLKKIQNSYNASVQTTELEVLRPVFDTEVLLLDELGAVKPTEWVWDTVSLILNTRYNDKRTTIITTNFPNAPSLETQEITREQRAARKETLGDRIGERMRSRLQEMCQLVEMLGRDYRQRKQRTI